MSSEPRRVEALLFVGVDPAAAVQPSLEWRDRTLTCGCVSRGRWIDTPAPPLRWWLGTTRRPCGAHMPRGKAGRENGT